MAPGLQLNESAYFVPSGYLIAYKLYFGYCWDSNKDGTDNPIRVARKSDLYLTLFLCTFHVQDVHFIWSPAGCILNINTFPENEDRGLFQST